MSKSDYEPGDLVRLKTGVGPVMVVEGTEGRTRVHCLWFAVDGTRQSGGFPAATLRPHEARGETDR